MSKITIDPRNISSVLIQKDHKNRDVFRIELETGDVFSCEGVGMVLKKGMGYGNIYNNQ